MTDLCGYDQGRPRREEDVHVVPDSLLALHLAKAAGRGLLLLRADYVGEEFVAELVSIPGAVSRPAKWPADPRRHGKSGLLFERGVEDRGLAVRPAILARHRRRNGRRVSVRARWRHCVSPVSGGNTGETPVPPAARRLAGPAAGDRGAVGLNAVVDNVRVYRDIYYTAPVWAPAAGRSVRLGADEYYVLGDNSAISADSRTWTDHPGVGGKCLVGKPLAIILPRRSSTGGVGIFKFRIRVECVIFVSMSKRKASDVRTSPKFPPPRGSAASITRRGPPRA